MIINTIIVISLVLVSITVCSEERHEEYPIHSVGSPLLRLVVRQLDHLYTKMADLENLTRGIAHAQHHQRDEIKELQNSNTETTKQQQGIKKQLSSLEKTCQSFRNESDVIQSIEDKLKSINKSIKHQGKRLHSVDTVLRKKNSELKSGLKDLAIKIDGTQQSNRVHVKQYQVLIKKMSDSNNHSKLLDERLDLLKMELKNKQRPDSFDIEMQQNIKRLENEIREVENKTKSSFERYHGDNDTSKDKQKRTCPNTWIRYKNNCYFFSKDTNKWQGAENSCKRRGGHLVKIESAEENEWLKSNIRAKHVWIGLNDIYAEGNWTWISDNAHVLFTDWHDGEPSNNINCDCGQFWREDKVLKWDDTECINAYQYICKQ